MARDTIGKTSLGTISSPLSPTTKSPQVLECQVDARRVAERRAAHVQCFDLVAARAGRISLEALTTSLRYITMGAFSVVQRSPSPRNDSRHSGDPFSILFLLFLPLCRLSLLPSFLPPFLPRFLAFTLLHVPSFFPSLSRLSFRCTPHFSNVSSPPGRNLTWGKGIKTIPLPDAIV